MFARVEAGGQGVKLRLEYGPVIERHLQGRRDARGIDVML